MRPTVPFPNSNVRTSRLGVGMATLMREPSAAARQRLLETAHDAGFRHFDVAPSYGLGEAEGVLGHFLRTHREGVTVGTKVGIRARSGARLMRAIQRPARALLRRFPSLRGRATQTVGEIVHAQPDFSPTNRTRSLETSLRALGTQCIDLLLLHEARATDVADGAVVDWLLAQKERGIVRSIGVATAPHHALAIVAAHPRVFDVAQVPADILDPSPPFRQIDVPLRITHSVLATTLARSAHRLQLEASWVRQLEERAGIDVTSPGELARLILAIALMENEDGMVLVGASRPQHLRAAPTALGAADADRLVAARDFLRKSLRA